MVKNGKRWFYIELIDYFFILLIINSFIFFYSLYTFIDIKIFHNLQGSKLKLKNNFHSQEVHILIKRFLFTLFFVLIFCFIFYKIFSPLYFSNEIIIDYGLHPFNICTEQPIIWKYCKMWFCITTIFTAFFISNMLHHFFNNLFSNNLLKIKNNNIKNKKLNNKTYSFISPPNKPLQLLIGETEENAEKIYLPEKSLYQNILITGTIGTGKTSSAMYPFTKQLISYSYNNENEKLGIRCKGKLL